MNRRTLVLATVALAAAVFLGGWLVLDRAPAPSAEVPAANGSALIRPHSPVLGPENAPVTIVEFFDPACEACRAFHPVLADIRRRYSDQVRVVMRYATFHDGSDVAVRILETARLQGVFEPVLEALLEAQPAWARHEGAVLDRAWAGGCRRRARRRAGARDDGAAHHRCRARPGRDRHRDRRRGPHPDILRRRSPVARLRPPAADGQGAPASRGGHVSDASISRSPIDTVRRTPS